MKKWDMEKWGNLCMHTCLPCRGISYVPGSESAAFEFHPFIVEDLLKFVNNSTTRDAFEAREALPLPKCWSKMNKSYPYDVAEVPMKVADVSIYISLQTRIRGSILHKTKLRDRGHDN